ncbi:MAG: WD40 repeat domain-containing protein [Spirochaetes bacterium]|nr:WD40 repeat domain-containing protein [Spirochaetota bacterium]
MTKNNPKIIVQKGHFSAIQKVAFRPQGDLLVTGPFMGSLGFWNSSGLCVNRLTIGGQSLQDLAWHPSGERFAAAGNVSVAVWTPGGEKRLVLDHPDLISALCYTPDGERLIVAMNSAIWIWSDGGERIGSAAIEDDGFSCLAVTAAGRIAAGTYNSGIMIYDGKGGLLSTLEVPGAVVKCVDYGRNDALLVGTNEGVLSYRDGGFHAILETSDEVTCLSIDRGGTRFAAGLSSGEVYIGDTRKGEAMKFLEGSDWTHDLDWHPSGDRIAVARSQEPLQVIETGGSIVMEVGEDLTRFRAVRFDDVRGLAPICDENEIYELFDIDHDTRDFIKKQKALIGAGGIINDLDLAPDGMMLVAVDTGVQVRERDGEVKQSFSGHREQVNCVAMNPAGNLVASGSTDGNVMIWTLGGETRGAYQFKDLVPVNIAWKPDGTMMAIRFSIANTIALLDVKGKLVAELDSGDRESGFNDHCWSRDGERLIASSSSGWIKTWDPRGMLLDTIEEPDLLSINAVAFDLEGNILAGNSAGCIHTWKNGKIVRKIQPKEGIWAVVEALAVSESGIFTCIESRDEGSFMVMRGVDGRRTAKVLLPEGIFTLRIVPDDRNNTVVCAAGNRILIYSLDGSSLGEIKVSSGRMSAMDFIAGTKGVAIAAGYEDGTVELMDGEGRVLVQERPHGKPINGIAFSPREDRFVSVSADGSLILWNREGGIARSIFAQSDPTGIVYDARGERFMAGFTDGCVRMWDAEGEFLAEARGRESGGMPDLPVSLAFNPAEPSFAVGFAGVEKGYVRVFSENAEALDTFDGFLNFIGQLLAYHSSGEYIVFTGIDHELLVYRLEDRSYVCTVVPVRGGFVAHTPDGSFDCSSPDLLECVSVSLGGRVERYGEHFASLYRPGLLDELFKA